MGTPAEKEYEEFMEKVKRTVYLDNLSPLVTEVVVKTALGQFGNVLSVQFLPNYTEVKNLPQCALVEMENQQEAKVVSQELSNYPFMMSGMPRPVKASLAKEEMFADRPTKPGRKIQCRWLEPKDPDIEVGKKLKDTTRRHRAEATYLLELQLDEEKKLAEHQAESLKANYNKYEMIDKVQGDGTLGRLARFFQLRMDD